MSKKNDDDDSDELEPTELVWIDPDRVDGVGSPASGASFLLVKSVAAPGRRSAMVKRPKRGRKAIRKASLKRAAKAARMVADTPAYSHEIPATNCRNEADSILASVTGERSSGLCSARTASGTPCMRPAVNGGRCHLHN